MKIIVKTCVGKKFEVTAEPKEMIYNLKIKIQEIEGIPPGNQVLIFAGRILEDEKWLLDYKITEGSLIELSIKVIGHNPRPIFIEFNGVLQELKICFCHNLAQLKEKIKKEIGFYANAHELYLNGNLLNDNKKDLGQLGIKEFSILTFDNKSDNCDYKEKYKNELAQLKDMGFLHEERNIVIIRLSYGNINYAIQNYYDYIK